MWIKTSERDFRLIQWYFPRIPAACHIDYGEISSFNILYRMENLVGRSSARACIIVIIKITCLPKHGWIYNHSVLGWHLVLTHGWYSPQISASRSYSSRKNILFIPRRRSDCNSCPNYTRWGIGEGSKDSFIGNTLQQVWQHFYWYLQSHSLAWWLLLLCFCPLPPIDQFPWRGIHNTLIIASIISASLYSILFHIWTLWAA